MKRKFDEIVAPAIVRTASLLVPRAERPDWIAEWNSELWHVTHACDEEQAASWPAVGFSLGSVRDAYCLLWDRACACTLILSLLAAAGMLACLCFTGTRNALLPLPWRNVHDLVLITSNGSPGIRSPSIRLADYREWTTDTAGLYSQIAWYRPTIARVHLAHHRMPMLHLALASSNLVDLLHGEPGGAPASGSGPPRLYFSHSAWRSEYHSDPHIFGRQAEVAGQLVLIAGVVSDSDGRLPGPADAWLLEDAHALATLPPTTKGFVVARIRDGAFPPPRAGWRSMVETRHGIVFHYGCISIAVIERQPLFAFACSLLLACLALPAFTALSLGDYPLSRERVHRGLVARRWLFLALKFVLVLAVVFFGSTALALEPTSLNMADAAGIQALTSFISLVLGFRWVLEDQRRRCPVCLRRLSNPARVGQASCNFLSWCGIELICASGHGLLHIPEMPTSWSGTQRWLCLDSSWLCLFAEPPAPAETI
jgi:hypothetical protein